MIDWIKKMLKKHSEYIRYSVVGVSAVFIDFIVYFIFRRFISIDLAKGLSYIIGSIHSFTFNKIWTFKSDAKTGPEAIKFAIVYGGSFFINIYLNGLVLDLTNIPLIAFFVATGTTIIINFIGQRIWIFKKPKNKKSKKKFKY